MTEAIDMSAFILAKSSQLNADDLMDNPLTIKITKVTASPETADQPVTVHYEGDDGRPLKPCKTVRRIMVAIWGKDASKYVGRSMTLYRDPTVAFGGMQVGGIRVSHMSHISEDKTVALLVTRGRKAPFKVKPLKVAEQTGGGEDAAAKWAGGFIAKLDTLIEVDAIDNWVSEKLAKLAELEKARPELHAEVVAAIARRKSEITPNETDAFGLEPVEQAERQATAEA